MSEILFCAALKAFADVVHHRDGRTLDLALEIEITEFLRRIVNAITKNPGVLPNLQVLEVLSEAHIVTRHTLLVTRDCGVSVHRAEKLRVIPYIIRLVVSLGCEDKADGAGGKIVHFAPCHGTHKNSK